MNKTKNVLVIIQTAVFGGPHNQVLQLAEPLEEKGYHYIALLPDEEGNAKKRLEDANIKVLTTTFHRLRKTVNVLTHLKYFTNFWSDVKRIRKIIREEDIYIVQICGLLNTQAGIAAKLEHKKIVWQLLSNYAPKSMRMVFSPIVYKLSDAIMPTGMIVAHDHPMIPKHKMLRSFFPPVNLKKFFLPAPADIAASRKLLKVDDSNFVIATIGNFNKQKAHEFLIEIFKDFNAKYPASRLRVLGSITNTNEDYYNNEVVELAKGYGLLEDGKCEFISVGTEVVKYAQGIDVFVLSSISEGIPTVMLEAMAMGKPVISTNVGSIAEIVTPDIGFLVKYGDKADFVSKLEKIYLDKDLREQLSLNAYNVAKQRFNIDQTLTDHLEVFDAL